MAKVTIVGDVVQLKSDLTKEEITRVKAFAPEALKLFDEDKNEVFAIDIGNASYSKYGICFCSEDVDGKVFMTMDNPVLDHSNAEKEREEVVKYFAPVLHKLNVLEENIISAKETLEEMEASVNESVVFA